MVGRDFSSREYFKQAARGRAYQTSIVMGVIHGERGMYYAHPVLDERNEVIGVLVMRIEAATFEKGRGTQPGDQEEGGRN